jgi:hypothetical protein
MAKMNDVEITHHGGKSRHENPDYSAPHPPLTNESDRLNRYPTRDPTGYSG